MYTKTSVLYVSVPHLLQATCSNLLLNFSSDFSFSFQLLDFSTQWERERKKKMKWMVPHPVPPHNGLTSSENPKEWERLKPWEKKKKDLPFHLAHSGLLKHLHNEVLMQSCREPVLYTWSSMVSSPPNHTGKPLQKDTMLCFAGRKQKDPQVSRPRVTAFPSEALVEVLMAVGMFPKLLAHR